MIARIVGGLVSGALGVVLFPWAQQHSPRKNIGEKILTEIDTYILDEPMYYLAIAGAVVLVVLGIFLVTRAATAK